MSCHLRSNYMDLYTFLYICVKRTSVIYAVQDPRAQEPDEEIERSESLHYSFESVRIATDNFSEANKLGQGGFGPVYKASVCYHIYIFFKILILYQSTAKKP